MDWERAAKWTVGAMGALALSVGLSCELDLDEPSEVSTLRLLAVTSDAPFPGRGQAVTLRMTYADALGEAPRPVEVTWMAGCVGPSGGSYYDCYAELVEALAGGTPSGGAGAWQIQRQVIAPEWSGVPDAVTFSFTVPDELFPAPDRTATAYVFFTACAGQLQPAPDLATPGQATFPLVCLDDAGNRLGPESFVPGFTELYLFGDGQTNANPPLDGIAVSGVVASDDPNLAPVVPLCADGGEPQGCGPNRVESTCTKPEIEALVPDVAEPVPGAVGVDGAALRETVWVNYYADAGELDRNESLVSDAAAGYMASHRATWTPPAEPGLVTLWAVAHDSRGGASVRRTFVRVE